MAIVRVNKTKDFTVMGNVHLKDKNLSFKAKGLMSWMLSLPENWDFTVSGIASCAKEGKDAIRNILNELEANGYLVREYGRDETGKYAVNYTLYEKPERKNQHGKSAAENPTQLNTKETNSKNKKSEKNKFFSESEAPAKPVKKSKSYAEIIEAVDNVNIKEALVKFINACKGRNYTPRFSTVEKWADVLKKESYGNPVIAMRMVEQSIKQGWKAIYPLKDKQIGGVVSVPYDPDNLAKDENGKPIVF